MTFDLCMTTASENTAKESGSADEAIIFGVIGRSRTTRFRPPMTAIYMPWAVPPGRNHRARFDAMNARAAAFDRT